MSLPVLVWPYLLHDIIITVSEAILFLFCLLLSKTPHLDIFSEVTLRPHEDQGSEGGVFTDFRDPFFRNVLKGGGTDDTEAQHEHICTGVAEWAEPVKLILEERRGRKCQRK